MIENRLSSLKTKIIWLLSALIIFVVISLTMIYIQNLDMLISSNAKLISETMIENEKKELHDKIDLANNILKMYYKQSTPSYMEDVVKKSLILHQEQLFNQLGHLYEYYKDKESKNKLKTRLKHIVKYATYGKNGYFWINDMHSVMVMHPIKPEYDGKVFIDKPLVPFVQLGVQKLLKEKTDTAFIKYKFYNPATKKYGYKVSLVRIFKPFGWVIGTGSYLSDITPLLKQRAANDIKALRYGQNGYFWINNTDYKMIMHPIKPEYDGKILKNVPSVPFVALGVDTLKQAKRSSTIISYTFYNPSTKHYENKLSIVKLFKPWDWIIGTGVYLNKINDSLYEMRKNKRQKEIQLIKKILLICFLIVILTIYFAFYLTTKFIVNPMRILNNEKEHFKEISQIDYLTGILNRRAFFTKVEQYLSYAYRNNLEISVMMLDIDFFKNINDTYGHEAGDTVLKKLTEIIKDSIREEDIFGRLGGEEFGLCILNSDINAITEIANKILLSVEGSSIEYDYKNIKITISIGAYTIQSNLDTAKVALNKADKALYKAKSNGRNRVEIYQNQLT